MLPKGLESKVKPYAIQFGNATVSVDVLDPFWSSPRLFAQKVAKLETQLHPQRRVAGIGFKHDSSSSSYFWLILCIGNHSLMIKLSLSNGPFYNYGNTSCLRKILSDPTILFVGLKIDTRDILSKVVTYGSPRWFTMHMPRIKALEIDHLVARILQKPTSLTSGATLLQNLAMEVGLDIKPAITNNHLSIDWNANVFSKEVIESVVYPVYYSSCIADKLMYG